MSCSEAEDAHLDSSRASGVMMMMVMTKTNNKVLSFKSHIDLQSIFGWMSIAVTSPMVSVSVVVFKEK